MPLSLKATVTRRQPEPDNPDNADNPPVENAKEVPNEATTDAADATPVPKAKVGPHALQMAVLNTSLGKPVTVFLINGIRLVGKLRQFDQFTLLLEDKEGTRQLVFKHAVSTIMPPARRPGPSDESHGNLLS